MGDEAVKRRLIRAKKMAESILRKSGYEIIPSTNKNFCLVGTRRAEVRMIRIVIDQINDNDKKAIEAFNLPGNCTREIWCKRGSKFEIVEI